MFTPPSSSTSPTPPSILSDFHHPHMVRLSRASHTEESSPHRSGSVENTQHCPSNQSDQQTPTHHSIQTLDTSEQNLSRQHSVEHFDSMATPSGKRKVSFSPINHTSQSNRPSITSPVEKLKTPTKRPHTPDVVVTDPRKAPRMSLSSVAASPSATTQAGAEENTEKVNDPMQIVDADSISSDARRASLRGDLNNTIIAHDRHIDARLNLTQARRHMEITDATLSIAEPHMSEFPAINDSLRRDRQLAKQTHDAASYVARSKGQELSDLMLNLTESVTQTYISMIDKQAKETELHTLEQSKTMEEALEKRISDKLEKRFEDRLNALEAELEKNQNQHTSVVTHITSIEQAHQVQISDMKHSFDDQLAILEQCISDSNENSKKEFATFEDSVGAKIAQHQQVMDHRVVQAIDKRLEDTLQDVNLPIWNILSDNATRHAEDIEGKILLALKQSQEKSTQKFQAIQEQLGAYEKLQLVHREKMEKLDRDIGSLKSQLLTTKDYQTGVRKFEDKCKQLQLTVDSLSISFDKLKPRLGQGHQQQSRSVVAGQNTPSNTQQPASHRTIMPGPPGDISGRQRAAWASVPTPTSMPSNGNPPAHPPYPGHVQQGRPQVPTDSHDRHMDGPPTFRPGTHSPSFPNGGPSHPVPLEQQFNPSWLIKVDKDVRGLRENVSHFNTQLPIIDQHLKGNFEALKAVQIGLRSAEHFHQLAATASSIASQTSVSVNNLYAELNELRKIIDEISRAQAASVEQRCTSTMALDPNSPLSMTANDMIGPRIVELGEDNSFRDTIKNDISTIHDNVVTLGGRVEDAMNSTDTVQSNMSILRAEHNDTRTEVLRIAEDIEGLRTWCTDGADRFARQLSSMDRALMRFEGDIVGDKEVLAAQIGGLREVIDAILVNLDGERVDWAAVDGKANAMAEQSHQMVGNSDDSAQSLVGEN